MKNLIQELQYIQRKLEADTDLIDILALLNNLNQSIIKTIQIHQSTASQKTPQAPTPSATPPKAEAPIFIHPPKNTGNSIYLTNPITSKTEPNISGETHSSLNAIPKHPYESLMPKNTPTDLPNKSIAEHFSSTPTHVLSHRNTPTDINEKMKAKMPTALSDLLHNKPITNLKNSMNLNERFLFLHELFKDNTQAFEQVLQILTNFTTLNEAEQFLQSEVIPTYAWNLQSETTLLFMQLLKRRFA